jgi:hypothetical protein
MTTYSENDKKIIAKVTILSGLLALACLVLGLMATQYDSEAFANPAKLLDMANVNTQQIRWFMITDMLGYYLLLLPAIFYAHRKLEEKTAFASLFTSLGFAYVLIGAIGASALAVLWPSLIEKHSVASSAMQEIYKADFLFATHFVYKGIWNYLEVLLCGTWWLGVGFFIVSSRALKITSVVLGMSCIVDGIGELLQLPLMAEIGLNVYLVLAIVWPVWIGIAMLRNKF